jgi:dTDP-glucose 4,6-dehydratase
VGPYLSLDTHFAIGNFIRNVLCDEDIHIKGDGTPVRSYLYASDLMIWLWTILFNGKDNYPYNVGSDEAISIGDLAAEVNKNSTNKERKIVIACPKSDRPPLRYAPSVERAKKDLNLNIFVPLNAAIRKTLTWNL